MGIANYLHHLFNPHCKDCQAELEQSRICRSCELLEMQLAIERGEKQELLKKILNPPQPVVIQQEPPAITIPKAVPWHVRRQMLEREDREKAKLMRDAPKPAVDKVSTEDLEKELGIAEQERETTSQS